MRTFFKTFFAALLALIVFALVAGGIILALITSATQPSKPDIGENGILVIDLSTEFHEQAKENTVNTFFGDPSADIPGIYDMVRMIRCAKNDASVKGIYVKANDNANGFAASEELRNALLNFKQSKKFVIAYGEAISQRAYYVANTADKIYCNPMGGVEWDGFSVNLLFLKGLLDKLEIEPQVFYAGKFKSATEPFRYTKMSDPNRLQTSIWLGDLYNGFLVQAAKARNVDTATLHQLANTDAIQTANDALKYHLVDGLRYDDGVKDELLRLSGKKKSGDINFITPGKYAAAVDFKVGGDNKIAIIYAAGDIVSGKGGEDQIGSDNFVKILRKVRLDDDVKAIVFRVNSPGGSSLASEAIWREVFLARKVKPVVVSMGDYAASGGYYISCAADSVFANPGTITGSIGVFSLIPNMQGFFNDKLGVTFDGVKTAPFADMPTASRPLTETEKKFLQASVDSIYYTFKKRVADGRKKNIDYIDSIAQGRVWTGERAINIGLVDKLGTLQNAVDCAARMAKLSSYRTKEYPEKKTLLQELMSESYNSSEKTKAVKKEVGEKQYKLLVQAKKLQELIGIPQTKLPFEIEIK